MARKRFNVRPAGACPKSTDARPHRWVPGEGADLLAYGTPDHGVTVHLGCCRYCGVALLSLGEHGSDQTEQTVCFELPDADLGEG